MKPIQIIGSCHIDWILEEIEEFISLGQTALQGVSKNDKSGIGKIKDLKHKETDYTVSLYDTLLYTNKIITDFNLYRTRIMNLGPSSCYSYHWDSAPRVHIPLVTDENCMLIIEDKIYRLPADGSIYLVDTTLKHTALNSTRNQLLRTHIVGNYTPNAVLTVS